MKLIKIIIDGMSESYVINNLVQGVRYSYTIMARDSINRNGIESPPVEFIVDSKYSIVYISLLLYVHQSLPLSLFPLSFIIYYHT